MRPQSSPGQRLLKAVQGWSYPLAERILDIEHLDQHQQDGEQRGGEDDAHAPEQYPHKQLCHEDKGRGKEIVRSCTSGVTR